MREANCFFFPPGFRVIFVADKNAAIDFAENCYYKHTYLSRLAVIVTSACEQMRALAECSL